MIYSINPPFLGGLQPEKKYEFAEPLFSKLKKSPSLQNHFSDTLKIASKGADEIAEYLPSQ